MCILNRFITIFFLILTVHVQAQIRYINCILNNNHKQGFEYSRQYYFDSIGRIEKEVIKRPYKIYKFLSAKSHTTIHSYTYSKDSLMYVLHDYPCMENFEEASSSGMCKDTIYTSDKELQEPYLFFLEQLQLPSNGPQNGSLLDTIIYTDTSAACNRHMLVYNQAKQLVLDSCISYMQTDCYVGEFKCLRNTYDSEGRLRSSKSTHIGSWGYYIELEYDPLTNFISRYRTDKTIDSWWYIYIYDQKP